jgi:hypothetical protein
LLEKNVALALLNTGALTESIEHFDNAYISAVRAARHNGADPGFVQLRAGAAIYVARPTPPVADWITRLIWGSCSTAAAPGHQRSTRLFFAGDRLHALESDRRDADRSGERHYASCAAVFCCSAFFAEPGRWPRPSADGPQHPHDEFTCASMEWVLHYLGGDWSTRYDIDPVKIDEALRHGGCGTSTPTSGCTPT